MLQFRVTGGIINVIAKLSSADDEYTPSQRQKIDARTVIRDIIPHPK